MIVGDGPLRCKLEEYVDELQLSSRIIFTGQRKDVNSLLRLTNVFVLSSKEREGLPLQLLKLWPSVFR